MTIKVECLAASWMQTPKGYQTIYTVRARYPRFIHSELMTHRMFSRNASSSRAIPVKTLVSDMLSDIAYPVKWGKNQKGMMDAGNHNDLVKYNQFYYSPEDVWGILASNMGIAATNFSDAGYAKQICNRLIEPFSHINVIITATEWENFFNLRIHEAADPTIRALAEEIKRVIDDATPFAKFCSVSNGKFHHPLVSEEEALELGRENAIKVSVARCARVTYNMYKGKTVEADIQKHDDLLSHRHMSPFEHAAFPVDFIGKPFNRDPFDVYTHRTRTDWWSGNFKWWQQYRQVVDGSGTN